MWFFVDTNSFSRFVIFSFVTPCSLVVALLHRAQSVLFVNTCPYLRRFILIEQAMSRNAALDASANAKPRYCNSCHQPLQPSQQHTCCKCFEDIHGKVIAEMSGCVVKQVFGDERKLLCKLCWMKNPHLVAPPAHLVDTAAVNNSSAKQHGDHSTLVATSLTSLPPVSSIVPVANVGMAIDDKTQPTPQPTPQSTSKPRSAGSAAATNSIPKLAVTPKQTPTKAKPATATPSTEAAATISIPKLAAATISTSTTKPLVPPKQTPTKAKPATATPSTEAKKLVPTLKKDKKDSKKAKATSNEAHKIDDANPEEPEVTLDDLRTRHNIPIFPPFVVYEDFLNLKHLFSLVVYGIVSEGPIKAAKDLHDDLTTFYCFHVILIS